MTVGMGNKQPPAGVGKAVMSWEGSRAVRISNGIMALDAFSITE